MTHNEARASWLKEGAIALSGEFSVALRLTS